MTPTKEQIDEVVAMLKKFPIQGSAQDCKDMLERTWPVIEWLEDFADQKR